MGFRAMLQRHQESRLSHVDRIRRNLPPSASPQRQNNCAGIDEVMRLKNELAIQRALRVQRNKERQNGYKPTVKALNEYTPLTAAIEKQVSERYNKNQPMQLSRPQLPPSSARDVVSVDALKELRRLVL